VGIFSNLFGCAPKTAATTQPATTAAVGTAEAVTPSTAATSAAAATALPPICTSGALAGTLVIYDQLLKDGDAAKTKTHMDKFLPLVWPQATPSPVQGWDKFTAELQKYSSINTLIIIVHGNQGELSMYKDSSTQVPKDCSQVAGLFSKCAPEITGEIILDNCRTGANPKALVDLLDIFRAPKITSWNYFEILDFIDSVTPQNVGSITIPDIYLHAANANTPASIAAASSGSFSLLYQWFRDIEDSTLPTASSSTKDFMPASNATAMSLARADALNMTVIGSPIEITELVKLTVIQ
jgi:hypothetical protein